MSDITINNLNNIIDGYREKLKILEKESFVLKNEIKVLKQELRKRR